MKAALRSKYGGPEVLSVSEVAIPVPKDNEVLVRVHAATVNRTDCGILWGDPYMMRIMTGFFKPRASIPGSDFAGEITAVGSAVKSFKTGDRVMGFNGVMGTGSHAEYLAISEDRIVTMPGKLSYEEAVACIEGAFYASVGIRKIQPKAGQNALVSGGTGAIGSSYVQFFKYYGVKVTATCGGENAELVRSLGADRIIDYKTEDFTKDNEQYDFVIDAVGKSTFSKCKRLLKKKGVYAPADGMQNIFLAMITPMFGGKTVIFPMPKEVASGLNFIKEMIEKGSFRPVIDRRYPFDKIAEAYAYVRSGQKIGNVIITMNS